MKGRSCGLFLCLFLGIACFSGYQVLRILHEYRVGADAYFKLEQFASLPPASEETEETPAELAWPEVDFTALAAVNPDVTAWLYGPDTGISYPVVQGTDNSYYLDHTWRGGKNSVGAIFMDYRNSGDLSDFNTIIYGHRMNNRSMFGTLSQYKSRSYWQAHPYVYLTDDSGTHRYEIFAAGEVSVDSDVYRLGLRSNSGRQSFLDSCLSLSALNTGVTPHVYDKVLTLSTCTGNGHATRWVVQAVCPGQAPEPQPEEPVQQPEQLPEPAPQPEESVQPPDTSQQSPAEQEPPEPEPAPSQDIRPEERTEEEP